MKTQPSNAHRPGWGAPALTAVVLCLGTALFAVPGRGEPIVFSKPSDGGFATNLYTLVSPEESRGVRDRLQERQLSASRLIQSQNVLDSSLPPAIAPRRVMATKEQLDALDKKKNWAFSMQEELDKTDPAGDEALKFIDSKGPGKNKDADTAEERYVSRMMQSGSGTGAKSDNSSATDNGDDRGAADGDATSSRGRTVGSVLRSLLDSGGSSGGISGLGGESSTLDRGGSGMFATPSSQRSRMSDFRALLEGRSKLAPALDNAPASPARIGDLPGSSAGGGSPFASSGLAPSVGSGWTRPFSSGLTPAPSVAVPAAPLPQAPAPLAPPSPLRMRSVAPTTYPPRR